MATVKEKEWRPSRWQFDSALETPKRKRSLFTDIPDVKIKVYQVPSEASPKPSLQNRYYPTQSADKEKRRSPTRAALHDALAALRRPRPVVVPAATVVIAFKGWVDRVEDGIAALRLEDPQGRRSVATYAVADLERDNIPAQVGTAFQCQVTQHNGGYQVSFLPVPRRTVSAAQRRQIEAKTIEAYRTLQNDY